MSMSMPQMIQGGTAGADRGHETFPISYAEGRALTPADEGANVAVALSLLCYFVLKRFAPAMLAVLDGNRSNRAGRGRPRVSRPAETAPARLFLRNPGCAGGPGGGWCCPRASGAEDTTGRPEPIR